MDAGDGRGSRSGNLEPRGSMWTTLAAEYTDAVGDIACYICRKGARADVTNADLPKPTDQMPIRIEKRCMSN